MTTQPTPRFTVRHYVTDRGCYISERTSEGICSWGQFGQNLAHAQRCADELNRLYDLEADVIKVFEDYSTTAERYEALYDLIASKQPPSPPAPATENVPLHKVICRTLPGESAPILDIMWRDAEHAWKWRPLASWHPLPINDDVTVTVLVDTPAATSDKGGRVMGAQRFRKKPVVVAAVRIDADDYDDMSEIVGWCGGTAVDHDGHVIAIDTLEGRMFADPGDWIIQGVKGEFYPCKPDVFEQSYEAVS